MSISEALKEKVHNAIDEQQFVGMVCYSEDEYQELLAYTSSYSRSFAQGIGSWLGGDDEIHFVSLVEIAKRWKNASEDDNGFWRYVFNEVIGSSDNPRLYNAYTDIISGLAHNKILMANTAKKYYATIMMHAFAPSKSMNSFFDFAYNIFKKDLDFDYTDDDKLICGMATEALCTVAKSLGGKSEEVSVGSGVYGIKIGLRSMALGLNTQEHFIDILNMVFCAINSLYHSISLTDDDYLSYLINEWWNAKAEKDSSSSSGKHAPATTKQNITPKFMRKDERIYLCIPPIRFSGGENPNLRLSIYVGNNTKSSVSKEIFTSKGEITVTSAQQEIELNDLLKDNSIITLRIEITDNGKEIFNKIIEKDFIVFDNEKEITNRVLKVGNYFVYSLAIDNLQTPMEISTIAKNLYNIYPSEGEVLSNEQRQIIFTNRIDVQCISNKIEIAGASCICKWGYKDKSYKVFGNRVNLLVPHGISANGLDLRIDGNRTLMSDITLVSEDLYDIYDITNMLPQRVPCEIIVYSHLKEKEIIHDDIILIPQLHVKFSKTIYYGDDDKMVRVSDGEQCQDLTWDIGDDEVSCPLCKGVLDITIPQLKWRIDMRDWQYKPIDRIVWYKDYFNSSSVLEAQAPFGVDTINLYCIAGGAVHEISQNAALRFEIGKYIFANEGRKNLVFFLKSTANNERSEICETTTIEHFTQEPPFTVDNDKMCFIGDGVYVGSKKTCFNIRLKRIGIDETTIKSSELQDGVLTGVKQGIYWIKVSVPSGGLFGSGEKTLWEGEFVFGDKEKIKLSNMVLKINPICGTGNGDAWKIVKSGYYLSELIRQETADTYAAKLYCKNNRGEQSSVCGFSKCQIEIISPIALCVLVEDCNGNYKEKLKGDNSGNLYSPQSQQVFSVTNYHFIEVKNV